MSRTVREPDPITTLRHRLRVAEQAASDVVVAMEAFRATLRQVAAAVDDLPGDRPSPPAPTPPPKPAEPRPQLTGPRFLRMKTVAELCGLSRTTIWRLERDGKFPARYRLGANSVGWLAAEVEEWMRQPRSRNLVRSYRREPDSMFQMEARPSATPLDVHCHPKVVRQPPDRSGCVRPSALIRGLEAGRPSDADVVDTRVRGRVLRDWIRAVASGGI